MRDEVTRTRRKLAHVQQQMLKPAIQRAGWAGVENELKSIQNRMPENAELEEMVKEAELLLIVGRLCVRPDLSLNTTELDIENLMDSVGLSRNKARAYMRGFAAGLRDNHGLSSWWYTLAACLPGMTTSLFSHGRVVVPAEAMDAAPAEPECPTTIEFGPAPTQGDILFVVSCDPGYFERYAQQYIESITAQLGSRAAIHIHLVGAVETAAVEQLGASWSVDKAETTDMRSHSAIGRYVVAPYLLERSNAAWCVITDIDFFLEQPSKFGLPDGLTLNMGKAGLPHGFPWKRVMANCASFPNNLSTINSLKRLSWAMRYFLREDLNNWGIDQNIMYAWKLHEENAGTRFGNVIKSPMLNAFRSAKVKV